MQAQVVEVNTRQSATNYFDGDNPEYLGEHNGCDVYSTYDMNHEWRVYVCRDSGDVVDTEVLPFNEW